jgi:hypothetical protein
MSSAAGAVYAGHDEAAFNAESTMKIASDHPDDHAEEFEGALVEFGDVEELNRSVEVEPGEEADAVHRMTDGATP